MPRCANCGKANKDGSLFCQDCGQRMEPVAAPQPARRASVLVPAVDGLLCSACGAVNPAGMNFCKLCGTALAARPAVSPVASAPPASAVASVGARLVCSACGKSTPQGFAFCQQCGQKLSTSSPARPALADSSPSSPVAAGPLGSRPAALAATIAAPASVLLAASSSAPINLATPPDASAGVAAVDPTLATDPGLKIFGRLIAIRRDGSDGESHPLLGDTYDLGRTDGSLTFSEDLYLAARHARVSLGTSGVQVRPLDRVNGVFLRVRGTADLIPGDQILIGKEVLRFELVTAEERDPPSLIEHGVRIFGTAPRDGWGRLRQLTAAGTTRDVWHLARPEFVLGREEGDITFPDDEYLSRRHAAIKRSGVIGGAPAKLEDLGSSNGTFLRIRGECELLGGDVIRLGDQLLRFEN